MTPTRLFLLAPILLLAGCASQQLAPPDAPPPTAAPPVPSVTAAPSQKTPAASRKNPVPIQRIAEVPGGITGSNRLTVPLGFKIDVFADGLDGPRRILIIPRAKGYDVLVAESNAGRVRLLRDANNDGRADSRTVLVEEQNQPYGLALHNGQLYIGNTDSIVRVGYKDGAVTDDEPEKLLDLPTGGHWTRNLLFSRDGKKLYVAVGSSCNTCEESDNRRAAILQMDPDGKNSRIFASGTRNPVGMAWRPGTGELWTVANERDNLGDDLPPDYLTKVRAGAFYGWPYALTDITGRVQPDPSFGEKAPAKVKATTAPTVPVQAHSAALGLAWYDGAAGDDAVFPRDYKGDAFLAFHGSWNRSAKTGYKIVRVHFENGVPVRVTDFVRGFQNGENVWGRPVDVATAPDGSLLFSDDGSNKIWRVRYGK